MEPTLQCEHCGNEFTPKKWWAHFCSLKCRNGWWSELRKLERQDKRELRKLARRLAIGELTRQGLHVESMTTREINRAADEYLAAHPELVEEAAQRLNAATVKEIAGLREHVDGNAIVSAMKLGRAVATVAALADQLPDINGHDIVEEQAAPAEPMRRRQLG